MRKTEWQDLRSAFNASLDGESGSLSSTSRSLELQREVDELLAHMGQADLLFPDVDRRPAELLPIGSVLSGRYRILAHIGSGGMGHVYEAEDEHLSERIALKTLPRDVFGDTAPVEQLRREIRHARKIVHRNVCRQYDIGYDDMDEVDGNIGQQSGRSLAYLTMERIEGVTLKQYLEANPGLPRQQRFDLAAQLCAGLAAAHRENIVHADLKPQNCMIERATGRLVILDFGLSRHILPGNPPERTWSRLLGGTPLYTAPERYEGSSATFATDLYSLGLTLHELLCSALPGTERDVNGRRPLAPDLPGHCSAVLSACLALNPADRPANVAIVADALNVKKALPRWRSRLVFAFCAVLLLVLGGLVIVHEAAVRAGRHRNPLPPLPAEQLGTDPQASDLFHAGDTYLLRQTLPSVNIAIHEFEQGLLKDPQNPQANAELARAWQRKYELTRQPQWLARADQALALAQAKAPGTAETLLARGMIERSRHQPAEAIHDLQGAVDRDPHQGEAWKQLARTLGDSGNLLGAEAKFEQGLRLNRSYWGLYQESGLFFYAHNQYERAERQFNEGLLLAPDQPILLASLGGLYLATGRLHEAQKTLEDAQTIEPSAAIASNLGAVYLRQNLHGKAVQQFRLACTLKPEDYRLWTNLGHALQAEGNRNEAEAAYRRAINLLASALQTAPHDTAILSELAIYSARNGDAAAATSYEETALRLAPQDAELNLQAAFAEAILGHRSQTLHLVEKALELGVPPQKIAASESLAGLRTDPEFQTMLAHWHP